MLKQKLKALHSIDSDQAKFEVINDSHASILVGGVCNYLTMCGTYSGNDQTCPSLKTCGTYEEK